MVWLMKEAQLKGLAFEDFLLVEDLNSTSKQHDEYKGFMRLLGKYVREIPDPNDVPTTVHSSVKERYENSNYTSTPIEKYISEYNVWPTLEN